MKRAVFPGTFDPITLGHIDIVARALSLFDEVIVAIGVNADKKTMFSVEERILFIERAFKEYPNVRVLSYTGLTARFCQDNKAGYILRGLRNATDLNYEQPIAQTNFKMAQIETVFLISSPEVSHISSTIVRDILRHGGNCEALVPTGVLL